MRLYLQSIVVFVLGALLCGRVSASEEISWAKDVQPIVQSHCVKCHGPEKQKGEIRFDTLSVDFLKDRAAAETWHDASDKIKLGEMPPEDEPQLSSDERRILGIIPA